MDFGMVLPGKVGKTIPKSIKSMKKAQVSERFCGHSVSYDLYALKIGLKPYFKKHTETRTSHYVAVLFNGVY